VKALMVRPTCEQTVVSVCYFCL